ncbi:MAG: TlpA family protein disulfide reductase [Solirubrobacteraceae bacterium]
MRTPAMVLGGLALGAALVIGILQAGGSTDTQKAGALSRAQVAKPLPAAPPALAALRRRVSEISGGGTKAFDAQLRALRGHPVVVNAWASWCHPCEFELPFFQRQAVRRGAKVAFVGLNVQDARSNARRMAARYPLPYPTIADPDGKIVKRFRAVGLPVTIFYDAAGKRQLVHQGVFASEQDLSAAIERYALK